ncbi:MAG: proton-conducting transporter membrane subunit [Elusimicrobiaceae bacterium]
MLHLTPFIALILPLAAGMVLLAAARSFFPGRIKQISAASAGVFLVGAIALLVQTSRGLVPGSSFAFPMGLDLNMNADYPAAYLFTLTGLLTFLIFMSFTVPSGFKKRAADFFLPALGLLLSAAGFALSTNMLWLFIFWETASLCSWLIKIFASRNNDPQPADRFFIFGEFGSLLILFGVIGIYAAKGTVDLTALSNTRLPEIPVFLILCGIAVKSGLGPFSGTAGILSRTGYSAAALVHTAVLVNFGAFFFLRFFTGLNCWNSSWMTTAIIVTLAGGLVSAGASLNSDDSRKAVILSVSANAAVAFFALCLGTADSVAGGMELMFASSVTHTGLFLCCAAAAAKCGSYDLKETPALYPAIPLIAAAFALCAMGAAGLPPAFGFTSKFVVLKAAAARGPWVTLLLLSVLLLNGISLIRLFYSIFFTGPDIKSENRVSRSIYNSALTGGALALAFGIFAYYPAKFIETLVSVVRG